MRDDTTEVKFQLKDGVVHTWSGAETSVWVPAQNGVVFILWVPDVHRYVTVYGQEKSLTYNFWFENVMEGGIRKSCHLS